MLKFGEPNSGLYKFALQLLYVVVGVRVCLATLLKLGYLAIRSHKSAETTYRISSDGVVRIIGGIERDQLLLSDIRRVQLKEIRFLQSRRWILRIKHKNRIWYELGIPEELRDDAHRAFTKLKIPFGVSSKPARGWLY